MTTLLTDFLFIAGQQVSKWGQEKRNTCTLLHNLHMQVSGLCHTIYTFQDFFQ